MRAGHKHEMHSHSLPFASRPVSKCRTLTPVPCRSRQHRGKRRDCPGAGPHTLDGLRVPGLSQQHPGHWGAQWTLQQNPDQGSRSEPWRSSGVRHRHQLSLKGAPSQQQLHGAPTLLTRLQTLTKQMRKEPKSGQGGHTARRTTHGQGWKPSSPNCSPKKNRPTLPLHVNLQLSKSLIFI